MGFLAALLCALLADDDCDYDDWDNDYNPYFSGVPGTGGQHRYVVNYLSQNGVTCGVEVLAHSMGQARDSVKCRSDVKYVTSSYEIK